jgi:putative DNA primase/helicase
MRTVEAAKHKWPEVLKRLGVPDEFLLNRHGPCPICGGSDRYRFDDKDGNGTYYCNSCGPGDGMSLAIKYTGRNFLDLAKDIDSFVGNVKQEKPVQRKDPAIRIRRICSEVKPVTDSSAVYRYIKNRDLPLSSLIRYHPSLAYYEDGKVIARFPAMVSAYKGVDGSLITLHITYLTEDGQKANQPAPKKILPPIRSMDGGSVRLTKIYPTIGIAEGIETALSVMRIFKVPCWASTTAGMMEKFTPPDGIKKVIVYADNDESFVGQKAAYVLAARLYKINIETEVIIPKHVGDFADYKNTQEIRA